MSIPTQEPVTDLLCAWRNGDDEALNRLTPLIYDELHKIAEQALRRERRNHARQHHGWVTNGLGATNINLQR